MAKARAHLRKHAAETKQKGVEEEVGGKGQGEAEDVEETKQGRSEEKGSDAVTIPPPVTMTKAKATRLGAKLAGTPRPVKVVSLDPSQSPPTPMHDTYFHSRKSSIGALKQKIQVVEFARDQVMWNGNANASSSAPLGGKGLSTRERQLVDTFTSHDRNFILGRIRSRQRLIKQGRVGSETLRGRVMDEFVTTMSSKH